MSGANPIKAYNEIQRRLEDIQREKHSLISEVTRLTRLREQLQSMRGSKVALPAQLDMLTSALSYRQHPPVNYFTDRYITPAQHNTKIKQLTLAMKDEQIQTVNAFTATDFRFTNMAGLGGILGCETGYGGRLVPLERSHCYIEELKFHLKSEIKKETDSDFDRLGSTLTVLHDHIIKEPPLVARKLATVPIGRVLYEVYAEQDIQRGLEIDSAELMPCDNVTELIAANLAKMRVSAKEFCEKNKYYPRSERLKRFENDKEQIRQMKNVFAHESDFSLSTGWIVQENEFVALEDELLKSFRRIDSRSIAVPIPSARPINEVAWQAWKLRCGESNIE